MAGYKFLDKDGKVVGQDPTSQSMEASMELIDLYETAVKIVPIDEQQAQPSVDNMVLDNLSPQVDTMDASATQDARRDTTYGKGDEQKKALMAEMEKINYIPDEAKRMLAYKKLSNDTKDYGDVNVLVRDAFSKQWPQMDIDKTELNESGTGVYRHPKSRTKRFAEKIVGEGTVNEFEAGNYGSALLGSLNIFDLGTRVIGAMAGKGTMSDEDTMIFRDSLEENREVYQSWLDDIESGETSDDFGIKKLLTKAGLVGSEIGHRIASNPLDFAQALKSGIQIAKNTGKAGAEEINVFNEAIDKTSHATQRDLTSLDKTSNSLLGTPNAEAKRLISQNVNETDKAGRVIKGLRTGEDSAIRETAKRVKNDYINNPELMTTEGKAVREIEGQLAKEGKMVNIGDTIVDLESTNGVSRLMNNLRISPAYKGVSKELTELEESLKSLTKLREDYFDGIIDGQRQLINDIGLQKKALIEEQLTRGIEVAKQKIQLLADMAGGKIDKNAITSATKSALAEVDQQILSAKKIIQQSKEEIYSGSKVVEDVADDIQGARLAIGEGGIAKKELSLGANEELAKIETKSIENDFNSKALDEARKIDQLNTKKSTLQLDAQKDEIKSILSDVEKTRKTLGDIDEKGLYSGIEDLVSEFNVGEMTFEKAIEIDRKLKRLLREAGAFKKEGAGISAELKRVKEISGKLTKKLKNIGDETGLKVLDEATGQELSYGAWYDRNADRLKEMELAFEGVTGKKASQIMNMSEEEVAKVVSERILKSLDSPGKRIDMFDPVMKSALDRLKLSANDQLIDKITDMANLAKGRGLSKSSEEFLVNNFVKKPAKGREPTLAQGIVLVWDGLKGATKALFSTVPTTVNYGVASAKKFAVESGLTTSEKFDLIFDAQKLFKSEFMTEGMANMAKNNPARYAVTTLLKSKKFAESAPFTALEKGAKFIEGKMPSVAKGLSEKVGDNFLKGKSFNIVPHLDNAYESLTENEFKVFIENLKKSKELSDEELEQIDDYRNPSMLDKAKEGLSNLSPTTYLDKVGKLSSGFWETAEQFQKDEVFSHSDEKLREIESTISSGELKASKEGLEKLKEKGVEISDGIKAHLSSKANGLKATTIIGISRVNDIIKKFDPSGKTTLTSLMRDKNYNSNKDSEHPQGRAFDIRGLSSTGEKMFDWLEIEKVADGVYEMSEESKAKMDDLVAQINANPLVKRAEFETDGTGKGDGFMPHLHVEIKDFSILDRTAKLQLNSEIFGVEFGAEADYDHKTESVKVNKVNIDY